MELTNEMLIPTFRASGLTQKEFCKVHNVSLEKLRYHLYRKKKVQIKNGKLLSSKKGSAFITFEKPQKSELKQDKENGKTCTIIHGRFNPKELAALIHELEKTC